MSWYTGSNAAIVAAARSYVGVPWVHQGRTREGIDCVGLSACVARDTLGLDLPIPADYPMQATDESMRQWCDINLVRVPKADMAPGHIFLMQDGSNRHTGIFGDYFIEGMLSLIHSVRPREKVIETRMDSVWRAKVTAVYRFPGAA